MVAGYATSQQALELMADDCKEKYEVYSSWDRIAARGYHFFGAASSAAGCVFLFQGVLVGSASLIAAGTFNLAMSEYNYRQGSKQRSQADLAAALVENWEERDRNHPLFYLPKKKEFSRTEAESTARPVQAFDTLDELVKKTGRDRYGLVNAVATKPSFRQELIANNLVPVRNGSEVPKINLALDSHFDTHNHVLLIGYNDGNTYRNLLALPAITLNDHYTNRRRGKKRASPAAEGLLWSPSPVPIRG
jgi:hypothetical protein